MEIIAVKYSDVCHSEFPLTNTLERSKYTHGGNGSPAAAGLWYLALKSGAARNRPLAIITTLIIHPRPPCTLQHTLLIRPSCVSVRPSWGKTGPCRWEEVDHLEWLPLSKNLARAGPPCSRALIRNVNTHPESLVLGCFPVSILGWFWIKTNAALGLGVFVSI